ncbi:MAG: PEGA domain-containing protein [Bacteroidetes bacterium]|nr:PEGA domain-containing protein [Bacteroidota bacterium]
MKKLLFLSLLFLPTLLFSQTLREFDLQEMSEQQIPVFIDHPNEGAIIFYTAIIGFTVESSTGGVASIQSEASKVTVFLITERQILTLKAPGFIEKKLPVENLSAKQAKFYRLNEKETSYTPGIGSYLISTIPDGFLLKIEGIPSFKQITPFELTEYEAKKYRINLTKPDYYPIDTLIEIRQGMKQSSVFQPRSMFGTLSLKAPVSVKVRINDRSEEIGTDLKSFRLSEGNYSLKVNDPRFDPYLETVLLEPGGTKILELPLVKRVGNYQIKSVPDGALIKIEGDHALNQKTPFELKDIVAGKYRLTLTKPDYYSLDTLIEIKRGQDLSGQFTLRSVYGALKIKSPLPVKVKIGNTIEDVGTEYKILKLMAGKATLSIHDSRVDPYEQTISIESGETFTLDLQLVKRSGYLQILHPDGFSLKINGENKTKLPGTQMVELFEGDYTVEVKRPGFQSLSNTFNMKKGVVLNWEPVFLPVLVPVTIETEPNGATVYLVRNGETEVLGFSPVNEKKAVGEVEFLIKKEGLKDYRFKVILEDGIPFIRKINLNTIFTVQYGKFTDINGNIYKTVMIGDQEWLAENLRTTKYNDGTLIENVSDNGFWVKASAGAYCAYDNKESNASTYGYLYNWYAVNSGKLAPKGEGWRVPAESDWVKLSSFLGGSKNAGVKLLSDSGWPKNTGGTDEVGFKSLPGGFRFAQDGNFFKLGTFGYWWSSTSFNSHDARTWEIGYVGGEFKNDYYPKENGFSVRLVRNKSYLTDGSMSTGENNTIQPLGLDLNRSENSTSKPKVPEQVVNETYTDIDGNKYKTITIGNQVWLAENLKVTRYNDKSKIQNIPNDNAWSKASSGGYCFYENNSGTKNNGLIYNWFAVNSGKLARAGSEWRVPSKKDWEELENYYGFNQVGTALKSPANGFNVAYYGYRGAKGKFSKNDWDIGWWSSSSKNGEDAYGCGLIKSSSWLGSWSIDKKYGYYIRLVRNK